MISNRPQKAVSLILSFALLCWGTNASAQFAPVPSQPVAQQQMAHPPMQQQPWQAQPMQQQPMQAQPIQAQPIQTPQFGAHQHQVHPQTMGQQPIGQQPMGQPGQVPMGTNVWGQPHTGQPNMGQQSLGPPNMPHQNMGGQPGGQVPRVAANPAPPTGGQTISLLGPGGENRAPLVVQPGQPGFGQPGVGQPVQGIPPGMQHIGRAEPEQRIIPFQLNPTEQRELDTFLARWENYSATIRRYEVDFNLFEYEPIPGAVPNVPQRTCFGRFEYTANPMRFVYVIEGEWRDDRQIRRDGDRNPHIFAEDIFIDDRTVIRFDYNARTVHQVNVPPEMIGRGIADSPLPLIFGARADDLKRRFSMRVQHRPDGLTVLHARPLLLEDQQEFRELVIMIESDTLRARGLKQYDINGMGHKVFELTNTRINRVDIPGIIDPLGLTVNRWPPRTPQGWTREERNWTPPQPVPAVPQMQMAHPPQNFPSR